MNTVAALYDAPDTPSVLMRPLLLAWGAAGLPAPADDHLARDLALQELLIRHPAATDDVRPAGDSMQGAGLYDGDILIVDRSLEPQHTGIIIAVLNGELPVTRLFRQGTLVQLRPTTHRDPVITVTPDQELLIRGVVTGSIRQFRRSVARWPLASSPWPTVTIATGAATGPSAPITARAPRGTGMSGGTSRLGHAPGVPQPLVADAVAGESLQHRGMRRSSGPMPALGSGSSRPRTGGVGARLVFRHPSVMRSEGKQTKGRGGTCIWEGLRTALDRGRLTRSKRKRMPPRWILRQNFSMIKSSWNSCGDTLVVPRSILVAGPVDTPRGCFKRDWPRPCMSSIIARQ
jgi:DNA polymerase V